MDLRRIGQAASLEDNVGNAPFFGVFGEQFATDIKNDVLVQFHYPLSSYDTVQTVTGTGTVTSLNHLVFVSTGAGTTSTAAIRSVNNLRYRPGHTAMINFTADFTNGGVVNSTQKVGAFDSQDGMYVGFNGTTRVVGYRNDGVDTEITEANWNGDPRVKDFTWDKLNVFRIQFGWLGTAPICYQVLLPGTSTFSTIHTVRVHGSASEPHIGQPSMPVQIAVAKTAGTTDIVVTSGSWQAGVMGLCQTCGNRPFHDARVKNTVTTTPVSVVNYRSLTTFAGKVNKIRAQLIRYQFFVDAPANGYGTIRVRIIANPTIGGTPSWTDISINNSTLQYDVAGTYTNGTGTEALTEWIGFAGGGAGRGSGSITIDANQMGLFLDPGVTYSIVADLVNGTGDPNVRVTFNWAELF